MKKNFAKLLPCAHCGSDSVRLVRDVNGLRVPVWHVECYDCGMRTMDFSEDCTSPVDYDTMLVLANDAIDCCVSTWNKRTPVKDDLRHDDNNDRDDDKDNDDDDDCIDYLGMREVMATLDHLCDIAHSWTLRKK